MNIEDLIQDVLGEFNNSPVLLEPTRRRHLLRHGTAKHSLSETHTHIIVNNQLISFSYSQSNVCSNQTRYYCKEYVVVSLDDFSEKARKSLDGFVFVSPKNNDYYTIISHENNSEIYKNERFHGTLDRAVSYVFDNGIVACKKQKSYEFIDVDNNSLIWTADDINIPHSSFYSNDYKKDVPHFYFDQIDNNVITSDYIAYASNNILSIISNYYGKIKIDLETNPSENIFGSMTSFTLVGSPNMIFVERTTIPQDPNQWNNMINSEILCYTVNGKLIWRKNSKRSIYEVQGESFQMHLKHVSYNEYVLDVKSDFVLLCDNIIFENNLLILNGKNKIFSFDSFTAPYPRHTKNLFFNSQPNQQFSPYYFFSGNANPPCIYLSKSLPDETHVHLLDYNSRKSFHIATIPGHARMNPDNPSQALVIDNNGSLLEYRVPFDHFLHLLDNPNIKKI
ncbi:MAG: hypothetical protein ACMXYG_05950 [Candidatus Woesearchaeota archaeon]